MVVQCDVAGCGRSFKSEAGLKVHKTRSHGAAKTRGIRRRRPGANLCQVNFCPSCGARIPNAIVVQ
jgi:hypothetical protein